MDYSFLLQMLDTPSPSGFEFNIQKKIMKYMHPYVDEVITHHSGMLANVLNKNGKSKILLAGHVDEIGLIIKEIMPNGLCKVCNVGGIIPTLYMGQKVKAITLKNTIVNGVCNVVRHAIDRKITIDDLYIDFGVDSKEECLKLVNLGDYIILDTHYAHLANDRFTAKALDDKLGAFVCLEALKKAKEYGCENSIYAVTTVGEETTMRGANFASYKIDADLAIVVDVTFVTNTVEGVGCGEVSLGCGPVLCHSSIVNKKLNKLMEQTANKYNIDIQYEVAVARTGTDADKIYFSKDGIPCILVSLPLKNMHSPSEICDLKDIDKAIELIARFICEYKNECLDELLEE